MKAYCSIEMSGDWRKLIHVPNLALFSFGSCNLPQILGTNGLVVVVVVVVWFSIFVCQSTGSGKSYVFTFALKF